jgi:hypothetical protein
MRTCFLPESTGAHELWQMIAFGQHKFFKHLPNLLRRANRSRKRIEQQRVKRGITVALEHRRCHQVMDRHVLRVYRRELHRQFFKVRRLNPVATHQAGHFDATTPVQPRSWFVIIATDFGCSLRMGHVSNNRIYDWNRPEGLTDFMRTPEIQKSSHATQQSLSPPSHQAVFAHPKAQGHHHQPTQPA